MLSKLLSCRFVKLSKDVLGCKVPYRTGYYIPASQYDTPVSNGLRIGYVMKHKWEILPLITVVVADVALIIYAIGFTICNKVDVTYTSRSRNCISRTMNLNNPTIHKLITMNQEYKPWPRMQAVLDKMKAAEKKALYRAMVPAK